MPETSVLKWHGGKAYLAPRIVEMMPRHVQYVEPYFGGGAVLFARDPDDERLWSPPHKGVSEVINDLNGSLTNFWRVLQAPDLFGKWLRRVQTTPFSGVEFEKAQDTLADEDRQSDVEQAAAFFVVNRQSLAGRMDSFTGITQTRTRTKMNNEVSAWLSCIDKLPEFHARLRRVLILPPTRALAVIRRFDGPGTFFYIDAPYVHSTRTTTTEYGAFEMTDGEHQELIDLLVAINGNAIVSMYHHPIYDALHCKYGWRLVECDRPNQASGAKVKKRMVECLWMNYPPP
jgi:DNA adenine methylase